MSKRNLLEEGTVRRFMKLAGNEALTSNILTEQPAAPEDELADAEADIGGLEAADMEMDVEEEPEEVEEVDEEVEDAVRAMVDAIADVASDFGVDVEVSEEEPAELEPEFEPEEELEEPEEELEEPEEGGEGGPFGGGEEEPLQENKRRKRKRRLAEGPRPPKTIDPATRTRIWNIKNLDVDDQALFKKCVKSAAARGKGDEGLCSCMKKYREGQPHGHVLPEHCNPKSKFDESLADINYIDEDAALNEVYHRVINRLLKEKRADDMAGVLAQRVARRLKRSRR